MLETFLFSHEIASEVVDAPNANELSFGHQKCIALARAFAVGPSIYLFDRPEIGLSEKQIGVFCSKLREEARLGKSIIVVSENRAILDSCDEMLVLQNGHVVEFGNASEVLLRQEKGWSRIVTEREFSVETRLHDWVKSHFRRPGDEGNHRKVSGVASEMLALSCTDGAKDQAGDVVFEFKNFVGYCVLKLKDDGFALTSSRMKGAESELVESKSFGKLSPLARILQQSIDIDVGDEDSSREISVRIETYDPRKQSGEGESKKAG